MDCEVSTVSIENVYNPVKLVHFSCYKLSAEKFKNLDCILVFWRFRAFLANYLSQIRLRLITKQQWKGREKQTKWKIQMFVWEKSESVQFEVYIQFEMVITFDVCYFLKECVFGTSVCLFVRLFVYICHAAKCVPWTILLPLTIS